MFLLNTLNVWLMLCSVTILIIYEPVVIKVWQWRQTTFLYQKTQCTRNTLNSFMSTHYVELVKPENIEALNKFDEVQKSIQDDKAKGMIVLENYKKERLILYGRQVGFNPFGLSAGTIKVFADFDYTIEKLSFETYCTLAEAQITIARSKFTFDFLMTEAKTREDLLSTVSSYFDSELSLIAHLRTCKIQPAEAMGRVDLLLRMFNIESLNKKYGSQLI